MGERAGYTNRGSGNIVIGREAGSAETNYTLDSDYDNNVLIGYRSASDRNLKKDISTLEDALDKVMNIRGVTYKWNMDNPDVGCLDESLQVGIIAQEVEEVYPELVTKTAKGYMGVSYGKFSAVLSEAIKEQQSMIDQQQQVIEELTRRMELLEGK